MPPLKNGKESIEKVLEKLDLQKQKLVEHKFDQCRFVKCNFSYTQFKACHFYDCEFDNCDLSLMRVDDCVFSNNLIENSKAVGINWAEMRCSSVRVYCPVEFIKCNISHSVFQGLDLREIQIIECEARDVDFSEVNLSKADLTSTDFGRTIFNKTNLKGANFASAVNYYIDVFQNYLKKTKFSLPEAVNLLNSLDIELVDPIESTFEP